MHRRLVAFLLSVPFIMLLTAASVSAGGFCRGDLSDARKNTVDMKDMCFFPQVVRVDAGERVTWVNYDAEPHTVTAPGFWATDHKEYFQNDKVAFRFDEEGTFPYVCLVHPGMVGAVVVGDGEGPKTAGSAIDQVPPSDPKASSDMSTTIESTSTAADGRSSGMSPVIVVTLAVGAALLLFVGASWARRRLAAGGPGPA